MNRNNDIDLKDYQPVKERLAMLFDRFFDARVVTEIIKSDKFETIFKASIYRDYRDLKENLPLSTGYSQEFQDPDDFINDSCFFENAETSAIGRALRNAGIGDFGVTKEEMIKTQVHHPFKETAPKSAFKPMPKREVNPPPKPISVSGPKVAGSDSFQFKKLRPKLSEDQIRNYVIPQGVHKGKTLDQVEWAELMEYTEFLRSRSKQSLWMGEFINHVDYFKTLNN